MTSSWNWGWGGKMGKGEGKCDQMEEKSTIPDRIFLCEIKGDYKHTVSLQICIFFLHHLCFFFFFFFFVCVLTDLVDEQLQAVPHLRGGALQAGNLQEHQPGSLAGTCSKGRTPRRDFFEPASATKSGLSIA